MTHRPMAAFGAVLAALATMTITGLSAPAGAASDTQPPSAPTGLRVLVFTSNSVRLGWTASTDNVGVAGYDVFKWATRITGTKSATTVTITGLDANRSYLFRVSARDAAGNVSTAASVNVTTARSTTGDTTAPSAPTSLTVVSSTTSSVRLGWAAATDNVAVTGYDLFRNGDRLTGTTSSLTVTVPVTSTTPATYTVKAHDAAGNQSAASGAVRYPADVSTNWPTPTADKTVTATITISGAFDGANVRYIAGGAMGDGGQSESQLPIFDVADGGSISNVIIGAPAADGIHCLGTCTLTNVWWEDVGEDAATQKGTITNQVMTVNGGGARSANDKVFQHNGPGTMIIKNFQVSNFGKLYRSCGNCKTQYKRTVIVDNVTLTAPGLTVVGINTNYGDTATLTHITIVNDPNKKLDICQRYTGNNTGAEPTKTGAGPDGTYCKYSSSDLTYK